MVTQITVTMIAMLLMSLPAAAWEPDCRYTKDTMNGTSTDEGVPFPKFEQEGRLVAQGEFDGYLYQLRFGKHFIVLDAYEAGADTSERESEASASAGYTTEGVSLQFKGRSIDCSLIDDSEPAETEEQE